MLFSWGPIVALFLIGAIPTLITLLRHRHPGWLLHLTILHFFMLSVVFFGNSRYRYPLEPLFIIIAVKTLLYMMPAKGVTSANVAAHTGGIAMRA
jgi:hypothetical protein